MNTPRFFAILGMIVGVVLLGFATYILLAFPNDAPTAPLLESRTTRAVVAAIFGLLFFLPTAYGFPILQKLQKPYEKNETTTYVHGFSWGAFLFTPAWAVVHRQWVLAGLSLVILAIPIFGVLLYAALSVEMGLSGRQIVWKKVTGHKSLGAFKTEEHISLGAAIVAGALVYGLILIPHLIDQLYGFTARTY